MSRPPFLRRRYLVDWKLQGSLCAHSLLYGGLVLVAIFGGIFTPLLWDLGGAERPTHIEEQAIVMLWLHERVWLLVLMCAVIVLLSAIKFSHRIAGPLVRYKRNLRWIADGKLPPPLRTRPGDYLKEEVACLNAAVAGIAARVETIRRAQAAVATEVATLTSRADSESRAEMAALMAATAQLATSLAAFTSIDPHDELPVAVQAPANAVLALAGDRMP
jgi:hypothetical protein